MNLLQAILLPFIALLNTWVAAEQCAPGGIVETLWPDPLEQYMHDERAFTQGLLFHEGYLYESTGLYGESTLRKVDPATGMVVMRHDLPTTAFGEGLARVDDRLYQITWREGVCYVYDINTFEVLDTYTYNGQGWGLAYDGRHLVMTDGSDEVVFRDPETFEIERSINVTLNGESVDRLNELEYVDGRILANLYSTQGDLILSICPGTGEVDAIYNCTGLYTREPPSLSTVFNGVAYNPADGTFYITGKRWPVLFQVIFVPVG